MSRPSKSEIVAAEVGDLVNPKRGEFFDNNLQSNLHKAGPKHPRVWWCREHGCFEVPT